jgi:branched-chain amino acid transport system ATP-binding protein
VSAPILEARGIRKRFGALTVLDGVDLEVGAGDAVGIVGPNGAGKTTLLNILAGSLVATEGVVRFSGEDVTSSSAATRARLGIGRAHQVPRPFGGMTVFENVLVGATTGGGRRGSEAQERSLRTLELCGLGERANRRAESLGLLDRKRLELARALATGPRVLLLDEVAGGLVEHETAALVELVKQVRASGVSIVWIEHIVHALIAAVDRLVVLHGGALIAEGNPAEVIRRPQVAEIYMGIEELESAAHG